MEDGRRLGVLVLTNMYPPHHYGGYELSCRDVMVRLAARGHDVTVLTSTARVEGVGDPPGERAAGVRRDLTIYWDDHVLQSPPVWRRFAIERANQRALAEAVAQARPDVVSVWNMGAMSLGLLTSVAERGIPMVLAVCDDWLVYGPKLDAWHRLFLHRPRLARLAGSVTGVRTTLPDLGAEAGCFVSDFTRRRAEAESAWSFERSTVVHSGIERAEFDPGAEPADPRPWGWRLLYVGRLDERKGIETLLRAMATLPPEARLDVLGRGDAAFRRRLDALVGELGLDGRVRFDVVDRAALAERYRAADVCVFPSEWDEPFGLVPVEAMACGTPVVGTGRGGSGEFLLDGWNALRFDAGDAGALTSAVRRLAGDAELRRRLVAGGRATAELLDTDRLADVFEAWHVAAAGRFRDGTPADRPTFAEVLGAGVDDEGAEPRHMSSDPCTPARPASNPDPRNAST